MSNITHITEANQVQISEHQLERFVEFINNAEEGFSALETLVRLIMEKSENTPLLTHWQLSLGISWTTGQLYVMKKSDTLNSTHQKRRTWF